MMNTHGKLPKTTIEKEAEEKAKAANNWRSNRKQAILIFHYFLELKIHLKTLKYASHGVFWFLVFGYWVVQKIFFLFFCMKKTKEVHMR